MVKYEEVIDMWGMHEGFGWWMVFGWIWMVAFWGLIIWAVATLISHISGRREALSVDPRRILEERFARGEINRDQFEDMKKTLMG